MVVDLHVGPRVAKGPVLLQELLTLLIIVHAYATAAVDIAAIVVIGVGGRVPYGDDVHPGDPAPALHRYGAA